jgi:site-specific DNA-methyltransferase (adenine-specific)
MANEAAGVKNAATRKYFTADHLWYFPPPETMAQIAAWANAHGAPTKIPYFSVDRRRPLTAKQWGRLRSKWNHKHGETNVWQVPSVRGRERLKGPAGFLHTNQKPLSLMELTIEACTDIGDVIWEPFGGLCSASVAAMHLQRRSYAAERNEAFFRLAAERLRVEAAEINGSVKS